MHHAVRGAPDRETDHSLSLIASEWMLRHSIVIEGGTSSSSEHFITQLAKEFPGVENDSCIKNAAQVARNHPQRKYTIVRDQDFSIRSMLKGMPGRKGSWVADEIFGMDDRLDPRLRCQVEHLSFPHSVNEKTSKRLSGPVAMASLEPFLFIHPKSTGFGIITHGLLNQTSDTARHLSRG